MVASVPPISDTLRPSGAVGGAGDVGACGRADLERATGGAEPVARVHGGHGHAVAVARAEQQRVPKRARLPRDGPVEAYAVTGDRGVPAAGGPPPDDRSGGRAGHHLQAFHHARHPHLDDLAEPCGAAQSSVAVAGLDGEGRLRAGGDGQHHRGLEGLPHRLAGTQYAVGDHARSPRRLGGGPAEPRLGSLQARQPQAHRRPAGARPRVDSRLAGAVDRRLGRRPAAAGCGLGRGPPRERAADRQRDGGGADPHRQRDQRHRHEQPERERSPAPSHRPAAPLTPRLGVLAEVPAEG